MDDSSDTSSLSSALQSDDERLAPIFLKARGATNQHVASSPATTVSPPKPKRAPSPPHEETLADNPDIAFLVMFRSRFHKSFPPKLSSFGPQDIERGVEDSEPTPQAENLLCALLSLVLNRKKPVERGHHGRALEEAIASQKSQWPQSWAGINPLHGNRNFNTMNAVERLNLLRTLAIWSLSSSEAISATIKESYKQSRHEDDRNQPLSVQPWGTDGDKRRYWLVEGMDDTSFRLYREGNRALKNIHWRSMAGTIDEVKAIATKLEEDGSQAARRLSVSIMSAIPRFEATEEKRKRREYRQIRRAQFARPEPGFSLYEGRTRGKRMRYTFDDDMYDSDDFSLRRSSRSSPAEAGPVVTASGRQVRQRGGGLYGESLLSGQVLNADTPNDSEDYDLSDVGRNGRATRSGGRTSTLGNQRKRKYIDGYNEIDRYSDEDDATSSGHEWDGGDDEDDIDDNLADDEPDQSDLSDGDDELAEPQSLIVKLRLGSKLDLVSNGGTSRASMPPTSEQRGPEEHHADVSMMSDDAVPAAEPVTETRMDPQPGPTEVKTLPVESQQPLVQHHEPVNTAPAYTEPAPLPSADNGIVAPDPNISKPAASTPFPPKQETFQPPVDTQQAYRPDPQFGSPAVPTQINGWH